MSYLLKALSIVVFLFATGFGGAADGLPQKMQAGLAGDAIWLFLPRFIPVAIVAVIIWCWADAYGSKRKRQNRHEEK